MIVMEIKRHFEYLQMREKFEDYGLADDIGRVWYVNVRQKEQLVGINLFDNMFLFSPILVYVSVLPFYFHIKYYFDMIRYDRISGYLNNLGRKIVEI